MCMNTSHVRQQFSFPGVPGAANVTDIILFSCVCFLVFVQVAFLVKRFRTEVPAKRPLSGVCSYMSFEILHCLKTFSTRITFEVLAFLISDQLLLDGIVYLFEVLLAELLDIGWV